MHRRGARALGGALCWLYDYDISFTIAAVHTLDNHYNLLYGMCRERRYFQWSRQDLLRRGAKMEIMPRRASGPGAAAAR